MTSADRTEVPGRYTFAHRSDSTRSRRGSWYVQYRPLARSPVANNLHFEASMPAMRNIGLTAIAIAWIVVLVLPRRRRVIAPKLGEARRFVSRRIVDEEARASSLAIDAWEGEGGTTRGASGADDINHANQVHANR